MKKIFLSLVVLGLSHLAIADGAVASKPHAEFVSTSGGIEFVAVGHPSALRVIGKGSGPEGKFDIAQDTVTGSVTIDMKSLVTGIDTRDQHMKEKYLEVEKYPTAALTISQLKLPKALDAQSNAYAAIPFQGVLKFHGVEKPVSGTFDLSGPGNAPKIAAKFSVKLSDYGVTIPSFAGVTIADEVTISVLSNPRVSL
jgi:polyisoprenoid-binding protein YceI